MQLNQNSECPLALVIPVFYLGVWRAGGTCFISFVPLESHYNKTKIYFMTSKLNGHCWLKSQYNILKKVSRKVDSVLENLLSIEADIILIKTYFKWYVKWGCTAFCLFSYGLDWIKRFWQMNMKYDIPSMSPLHYLR